MIILWINILLSSMMFSCNGTTKDQVKIEINENIDNLSYEFKSASDGIYKVTIEKLVNINDTIIINNTKIAPPGFSTKNTVDYYSGGPPFRINYKKFLATEVDIKMTYTFHD